MARKKKGLTRKSRNGKKGAAALNRSRIVHIHGIGQQLEPVSLKREWDLALFGRDMGSQTDMAYWADILHGTEPRTRLRRAKRA
jgi:hypothetical protein